MFFIKPFQPEYFQEVISIEQEIFKEHDPYTYMELYESVSDGFLVAIDQKKLIGFVVGFLSIPGKGRIFTIAVLPKYQNKGIGTNLLTNMCSVLKKKGAKEVGLEVRMSNFSAQQFYLKRDFIPVWVENGYYSDGENALVLKKEL
ncbi:MAG: ribosomal protein S18-alanine N-acetyltransferase [Methanosarcinales archaeon]|nr:ribosomal protein S18-alanine N-acetyltransferase [Methanosarcinales archaeon]